MRYLGACHDRVTPHEKLGIRIALLVWFVRNKNGIDLVLYLVGDSSPGRVQTRDQGCSSAGL